MSGLVSKWFRLAQMGLILDSLRSVSVHFGLPSQNVLKLILKSPRFVLFVANLTHFGAKLKSPATNSAFTNVGHVCHIYAMTQLLYCDLETKMIFFHCHRIVWYQLRTEIISSPRLYLHSHFNDVGVHYFRKRLVTFWLKGTFLISV